ncbi:hypothetical protein P3T37_001459 [Kitasatospora sp. MAA4]|uniref:hypothetical protein n=1 Tax=Kitasatospora sp. MAA4 TaxID=3035093 RepID=UPI00247425E1|nr:hypothetical protein [Kitasatospora sp. MAA4]MDH6132074.1 hypothetical protein [Kitasatospora sp. MAA4]
MALFDLLSRLLPRRVDDDRWDTWSAKARVLAVTRTLTSATRVLDVLPLLRPQDGIELYITVNPGSAFAAGLDAYLASLPGITVLPWSEATRRTFDLAVACTVHRSMHQLRAPLVVLPHGAGYNRLVRPTTGDDRSPAGLSRHELTWHGRPVPVVIGLSHEEQLERLRLACPEALPRARVVGDPCFDRLLDSLAERDRYRRRLGAVAGRKLVVVSSTWSAHSSLGRFPELPLRLVRELPVDEYAVAVVLHPNIWARHNPLGLLREAEDSGLLIIPPHSGWQAALVAADWVVGDHGSVSLYGAALDRVTLLTVTGEEELDPGSPTYAFGRGAPALDLDRALEPQLHRAAELHDRSGLAALTERSLGERGHSVRILREILYSYLHGVDEPKDDPQPTPYADPVPVDVRRPTSYDVVGEATAEEVALRRYAVGPDHTAARGFYAVTAEESRLRRRLSAEVIARTEAHAEPEPATWLERTAAQLPGLAVAVAALEANRHLVRLRSGLLLEAEAVRPWGSAPARLDPVVLGAAVALRLADRPDADLTGADLVIRTAQRITVRFTARPPAR